MLLHVLGHVEGDQRRVVTEQELGECLGELGLADTGRAEEDERARRTLRVLQAGRVRRIDCDTAATGVLLADDPLVQLVFHVEEALGLLFGELVDGDAGPQREHFGDGFFVDLVEQVDAGVLDLGLLSRLLFEELLLFVAEAAGLFELLLFDGGLLGLLHVVELRLELAQVGRGGHALDAQPRAGLVDQVDRLVGQDAGR